MTEQTYVKPAYLRRMEGEYQQALEAAEKIRRDSLSHYAAYSDREWELMMEELTNLRRFIDARTKRIAFCYEKEKIPFELRRFGLGSGKEENDAQDKIGKDDDQDDA